jgi:hypothetical protein
VTRVAQAFGELFIYGTPLTRGHHADYAQFVQDAINESMATDAPLEQAGKLVVKRLAELRIRCQRAQVRSYRSLERWGHMPNGVLHLWRDLEPVLHR